ncbi:ATP-dependent nuclease [Cryobacterium arcticum]|uniref:AAA domain protein n=1 Tax=Cryobacterium arcticum TaxID=670052 RepID=A0A1B1BKH3_9MICO|nr:ATP-binding protein [Cryobacterium arcticum]ANP73044.1 AAA domain protein [Cryobacterium arcticum]
MRVRRIEIQNFRGIKSLDFRIPHDKKFICLIGPGDSSKSTIIDAINLTLGERWSLSLSDTDFYDAKTDKPIVIRIALADLPAEIRTHALFGLHLSGIDSEGEWQHDPIDGVEPCVIVELRVESEIEPIWSIYRPGGNDNIPIGSGLRRKFSVFKVDDRIDNHLRWTKSSALTRLTDSTHGASGTLSAALVAARIAVNGAITPELQILTDDIGARLGELGSGNFSDLKPGLDTSLSTAGGNLALFEGEVPLTSFGLGTRRLAGIATQEMASQNKSVILIDEVEYGLEPHRLVHLLKHLRADSQLAQVFVTTHSPVAVEQLESSDLAVVRCVEGAATSQLVPIDLKFAQATLRGGPSSFLAKKIIVTEGKTEFGLLLSLLECWDTHAATTDGATSAANGVAVANGNGSVAPYRAAVLAKLGYDVVLFIDNDERTIDAAATKASEAGAAVLRWRKGNATENEMVDAMGAPLLTKLLAVAVEVRVDEATVRSDLLNAGNKGLRISGLDVESWISVDGFTLESARALIANTALKSKWFKSVGAGRTLGVFINRYAGELRQTPFGQTLLAVKAHIYPQAARAAERGAEAATVPVQS